MMIRDRYSSGYYPARFLTVNYWPQSRVADQTASIRRGGFSDSDFDFEQRRRQRRQIESFLRSFLATQG